MTISIWRYSHLILALASSLFLFIACITGVILAIDPITHQSKNYAIEDLETISLATVIENVNAKYDEVFSVEIESSGFIKAAVLTQELETLDIYIDPRTGEALGNVEERPALYTFATNLHRSLFLKSLGRIFVGFISLLLVLIATTGFILLVKRQGGIRRIFSKVQKDYFQLRYHVVLSRWLFIPIMIVGLTGVYLSAEKFELLPDSALVHHKTQLNKTPEKFDTVTEIPIFQELKLDEIRKVEFPFSNDPTEYFQIALKDKEIRVNQQTGAIISSADYPFVKIASRLSFLLHTGEGSVIWSLVLLISSAAILFFMYSGFVMTLKRRKKVVKPVAMPDKDECEFILLVGSETGTTFEFANLLFKALKAAGKSVYVTELNNYSVFLKAKHIIVLTATYGQGEPTTNARKFEKIFPALSQPQLLSYAVVGFGSLEYPDYCKFALQVDALLQNSKGFKPVLPLYKINNASFTAFNDWVKKWSDALAIPLKMERSPKKTKALKPTSFIVSEKTERTTDETFLLRLKSKKRIKFQSGDLLSIFPNETTLPRQYSVAAIGKEILLSIKKHDKGRCSSYLAGLKKGAMLNAAMEENAHFHFPKKATSVILIANGTGIAPFLGMIKKNKTTPITLFWGGRTQESAKIYYKILEDRISASKKVAVHKCFSREGNKKYVQDLITENKEFVLKSLKDKGVIMICGSLAMQHAILDILEDLVMGTSLQGLDILEHNGQLKMDCY